MVEAAGCKILQLRGFVAGAGRHEEHKWTGFLWEGAAKAMSSPRRC
jgi:hypothetical protein